MVYSGAQDLLDQFTDGVLVVTANGYIQFYNKQVALFFYGDTSTDLIHLPIMNLIPDLATRLPDVQKLDHAQSLQEQVFDTPVKDYAGNSSTVETRLRLIREKDDTKILVTLRDMASHEINKQNTGIEYDSVRLMHQVSAYANQTDSFSDVLKYCLDKLVNFMDCAIGHVYIPDAHCEFMVSSGIWAPTSHEAFEKFVERSEQQSFRKGEGLIGKVWEEGKIGWLEDINRYEWYLRIREALDTGLRQVIAVPVITGKSREVIAILEFYNKSVKPVSKHCQQIIGTVAEQIAHVKEREHINRQMSEQDAQLRQLFDNARFGMIMMNPDKKITMANRGFQEMFNLNSDETIGKKLDELIVGQEYLREHERALEQINRGEHVAFETIRHQKDGSEIHVLIQGIPVQVNNRTLAIFGMFIDITRQKQLEKEQQKALREKEVMMAEIHHRVKNNLAIIQAFLLLQTENASSSEAKQILRDSTSRIYSIALAHEQLYSSQDLSCIQLHEYLPKLIDTVKRSTLPANKSIDINVNVDNLELDIKRAIPIGLMVNELVTNSLKHAFEDQKSGLVDISVQKNGQVEISVKDNGVGFSNTTSNNGNTSLGLKIIKTLSQQLNAEVEVNSKGGTEYVIRFSAESGN